MGGEKFHAFKVHGSNCGSPPRGRGKVGGVIVGRGSHRITPAWAGKRLHTGPAARRSGDHPRVGGEKGPRPPAGSMHRGSPPRGRGKAGAGDANKGRPGITPAWAGKRAERELPGQLPGDHPRVGGEKMSYWISSPVMGGSPPRGRGKAFWSFCTCAAARITPAWAGKSPDPPTPPTSGGDHPRVGGEKCSRLISSSSWVGSPPRGRGKATPAESWMRDLGITPAWAGKRAPKPWRRPAPEDHPRVGGEKRPPGGI